MLHVSSSRVIVCQYLHHTMLAMFADQTRLVRSELYPFFSQKSWFIAHRNESHPTNVLATKLLFSCGMPCLGERRVFLACFVAAHIKIQIFSTFQHKPLVNVALCPSQPIKASKKLSNENQNQTLLRYHFLPVLSPVYVIWTVRQKPPRGHNNNNNNTEEMVVFCFPTTREVQIQLFD